MFVKVEGAAGTLKALAQFEPDMAKAIGKELNKIGRDVRDTARALVPDQPPMHGWRTVPAVRGRTRGGAGWPAWNPGNYAKTIRSKRREFVLTVESSSEPALMIYELAGTKGGRGRGSKGGRAAAQFLANLPAVPVSSGGKRSGRVMVRAVVVRYKDARQELEKAVNKTADALGKVLG